MPQFWGASKTPFSPHQNIVKPHARNTIERINADGTPENRTPACYLFARGEEKTG
jgi:hypothetical protein